METSDRSAGGAPAKRIATSIMGEDVYQQMLETRALAAINSLRADEPSLDAITPEEKSWLLKAFHRLKKIDEGRSKARPGNKPPCIFEVGDVYVQFLASSIEKILCEARGSGPAEFATILLPNCSVRSRTGQHLAKAMLENEQLIETCWYGIVREVIAVAEFRVRCFQPLSHLSGI